MIFRRLAYAIRKKFEWLVDLIVAIFLGKLFFHAVKDVEELKKAIQATDDFDFEKSFFVELLLSFAVEVFSCFIDDVYQFLKIQSNLQVLFLDLYPHFWQFYFLLYFSSV